ncbi:MAG: NAD(+) synthase [Saccharofermentans sp.]|nr:NAD(+) synthase [Saccharofermentans sp.]
MVDSFIRVGAATPEVKVADTAFNESKIIEAARQAAEHDCGILVFPELSITGYTCGDLFLQTALLESAKQALLNIASKTSDLDMVIIAGLPVMYGGKLYNCAAVMYQGDIIGLVPKQNIPNYSEFYEMRYFTPFEGKEMLMLDGFAEDETIDFGPAVFEASGVRFAVEICEDLWVPKSPSVNYAAHGAQIIFNLSCSDEVIGKAEFRRNLVASQSAKLVSAYVYADAGLGESTTDMVFAGHNIIAENGKILSESRKFEGGIIYGDIDIERLTNERKRMNTFKMKSAGDDYINNLQFDCEFPDIELERHIAKTPFVPEDRKDLAQRCEDILNMQAAGLLTRLSKIGCKKAVIGLSGGLDSTLALIVTVHAFDRLGIPRDGIIAITMPGFGTTSRTKNNSMRLAEEYGCTLKEISISDAVTQHFKDIGHDPAVQDITYENSQARERTQILMDIANQENGLVVGTGDLSELALGWATYNGDHMSMYGVNASIPKTLVRHLVSYEAERTASISEPLSKALEDIVATPVSPELLPPTEDGQISQKTEEQVGPYELHDFFLYYFVRCGFAPSKIYRLAQIAFEDAYDDDTIYKWEETFIRRFFAQQFKRSCLPDGPKVGTVTLSPRGDWRMPSDASRNIWLEDLKTVKE